MQTVNELGWVIEGAWSPPSTPEYWAGSSAWTSDHMKALRFARREDAEQAAYLMCTGLNVRICEHAWVTNSSRGERSQPATPDTKTGDGRLALPVDAPEIVTMSEPKDESVNQWQPIETAPKQRKIIVHYLNGLGKHRTVMACYYGEKSLEMHDDYDDVGTYDDESGTTYADAGWYEEHDSDNPILPLAGKPTHWMPLPAPPVTAVTVSEVTK
jgi:hypothetical protein